MQKLKMKATKTLTLKEGCEKYLEYCRQRNLREGTINHYRQSYTQFYKFFDPDTPIEEFGEDAYKRYVLHLKATLKNDVSINSYLRDYITTPRFLSLVYHKTLGITKWWIYSKLNAPFFRSV